MASEICFNCGAEIKDETPPFGCCMGGDPEYMCRKCNDECGDFLFRRKLQIMIDKADEEDLKDK